jgi:hypothetical protein
MIQSRTQTYFDYKKFKQGKDNRNMDELCSTTDGQFNLQIQQQFMKEQMDPSKKWKRLLLYHNIGSGKTCTGITMAEEWLLQKPTNKVTVILPARLKTNFIDELLSQCAFEKYISNEDLKIFNESDPAKKKRIKAAFTKKIEASYDIYTFEAFILLAKKTRDLQQWITKFTKDRFILIDEVHNLINTLYTNEKYEEMVDTVPPRAAGVRTLIFKYLMEHADPSSKIVLMTATPVFDNILQFKELVSIMSGVPTEELITLKGAIEHLRGMVSYFSGTSDNAYPSIEYVEEEVPMSLKQSKLTEKIVDKDDEKETSESFLAKQRQIAIAVPNSKVLSNLKEYAPKIKRLYHCIVRKKRGKHLVFSNFIKNGLAIVEKLLIKKGWMNYLKILDDPEMIQKYKFKVYVLWDATLKDKDKQAVKSKVNSISNIDGKFIKVVLGSPSIKEGVSFKHIQHLHMLDPVWNNSAKRQVEGRAIRFCSHSDIPKDSPILKRSVMVHLYKSIPHSTSTFSNTCDQKIYDIIIPEKKKQIDIAEKALKRVAIDNFLFRNMYEDKVHESPDQLEDGQISPLNISDDDFNLKRHKVKGVAKQGNCPKVRWPDDAGNCPTGMYMKENKHGILCCYKKTKTMLKAD